MRVILVFLSLCSCVMMQAQAFWLGADISGTTEMEARGVQLYNAQGEPREATALMRELGLNAVRLRVWVNPKDGFCNLADVVRMALRAKDCGMALMIDFHYSDWWADPGQQNIPAAWKDMSYEQMCKALYSHTREVLSAIKEAGVEVHWVQVGNETTNGFLWPMGSAKENMRQYAGLTDAGYQAVKQIYPKAQVIIHLDGAFDPYRYDFIFDGLRQYKARYDMIGLSLYPSYWSSSSNSYPDWRTKTQQCVSNLSTLHTRYNKPIMLVEFGMPASEPDKAKAALEYILDNTKGFDWFKGIFYWEPESEKARNGYDYGAFSGGKPTIALDPFRQ